MSALRREGDPAKAAEMARYHKTSREVLGVSNPVIDALAKGWRGEAADLAARVALADGLWRSGVFEARIAAAKLLTQARIRDDGPAWRLIAGWVPEFDGWAIADAAASAGARRLQAAPERLDEVEGWTRDPSVWVRRAALVMTLPWAKLNHLSAEDAARRARVLGWAAGYVGDREWFIQKAIGGWLRTLSKHDPEAVRAFLEAHGDAMKPFAVREASRHLR
ncbi:MAG: DNA alkylation repair protein [Pseudomonadota bacterium]